MASGLAVHFTLSLKVTSQKKFILQGSHGLHYPRVKRSALHSQPPDVCEVKVGDWFWIGSTEAKLENNLLLCSINHKQIVASALWGQNVKEIFHQNIVLLVAVDTRTPQSWS